MDFKLIVKKLNGTLSADETAVFKEWYGASEEHRRYYQNVERLWLEGNRPQLNKDEAWQRLSKRLVRQRPLWKRPLVAAMLGAAVVLTAVVGYLLNPSGDPFTEKSTTVVQEAIQPGRSKAILTMDSGKKLYLGQVEEFEDKTLKAKKNNLTYKKDSLAKEIPRVVHNYLEVPRGGQFSVTLTDGTKIWLNSGSKIKYPVSFVPGQERRVELLYGEAYFEVASSANNQGSAFTVGALGQEIQVLGTKFNINAHEPKKILSTLVEGSIMLSTPGDALLLKPSQQASWDKEVGTVALQELKNASDEIAWIMGVFYFKEKTMEEISQVLARWYDIEVVFENPSDKFIRFNGALSKNQTLESILEVVTKTSNLRYTITDRKLIIK